MYSLINEYYSKGKTEYPYLGKFENLNKKFCVVLFTRSKTGTVVYSSSLDWRLGQRVEDSWEEHLFKPFNGVVTLNSDDLS